MSWAGDYFKLLEEEKKKKKEKEELTQAETFETSPYSAMGRLARASSTQAAFQQATKSATAKWKEEKAKEEEEKAEEEAKKRLDVLTQTSTLNDPAGEFGAFLGQKIGDALTREKDGEKWYEGWFQKGNEKDVAKTILGTGADASTDFTTGIVGMGEKFVDWLAGIAPYVAQAMYYSNGGGYNLQADRMFNDSIALSKSELEKFAEKDLYDEEEVAKEIVSRLNSAAYLYQINQSGSFATPEQFAYSQQIHQETKKYMDTDMEDDSVLAHKSDALVQSSGQLAATAALSAAGVPWWVTTGTTAWGGELENALKEGATLEEANLSGAISAAAEVLTEKISGGISFGGKTLDDAVTAEIARGISNKVARNLAKIGVDMAGEGAEEVLSGFMSNLGSALYKEENLGEILFSEEAIDEYIESFISGSVLGGGSSVNTAITSAANGVDAVSGLNKNEQSVVDKVYKDAIKEAEQDGNKLTSKEKAKIYDEVLEQMEKGYISTDIIEEVLGDKSSYDALKKEADEFDKLYNTASMELSKAQQDRLAELEAKNKENPYKDLLKSEQDKFSKSVFDLVKGDRLSESYAEKSRRSQVFEADLSQYDSKQRQTIQKAIDSGILNNTNRTHEFVDMIAKISADKGVLFDFINNEKLKSSGFAVDGKQVNGFVTKDGVTLNVNSAKSLNKVVGHEITHVLEGTDLYAELQKTIVEYAKSKGDYQSRYDALAKLYENIEGANVDAELTAELVGEYLFTDQDFVNNLSVQNQNVFQKIWDEIKYLAKVATAGSKEAKELAKVQRAFEKAYREAGKAQVETKYSIGEIVGEDNKSYGIGVHLDSALLDNLTPDERKAMVKERIKELGGEVFTAYDNNGNAVDITIAKHNAHFKNANGKKRLVNNDLTTKYIGDEVKQEAVVLIDELITTSKFQGADPAKHAHGWLDNNGQNDWDVWTTYIQDKNNTIWEATLHIANTANGEKIIYDVVPTKKVGQSGNSDTSLLANNVAQSKPVVKRDYSLSDSDGRQLSPVVQKRFANSKVVDEDGNLKPVFHGTATGEFSIFDKSKGSVEGDFGSGFYFTDNEADVSEHYEGGGPDFDNKVGRRADEIWGEEPDIEYEEAERRAREELYKGSHKFEVYLNIENPAIVGETMLFDSERYMEQYNEEDYDDYDDYLADVEQLVADDIENIVWEVEKNVDVYNTDGIAGVLWDAYAEGGMDIEDLKKRLNDLYLEDSNGNFVANEVARQIIESLGYDGIIDPTVSGKWNMDIEEGTTHYIVFKPNQIKSITNQNPTDNPDINMSLSEKGQQYGKEVGWNITGRDVMLQQDIAPVAETVSETEDIAPVANNATSAAELFPDTNEPGIDELMAEAQDIMGAIEAYEAVGDHARAEQLVAEYEAIMEKVGQMERYERQRADSLMDADVPPVREAPLSFRNDNANPFASRDWYDVGDRKVNAFMTEHPEVTPFFQEMAGIVSWDLADTVRAERWYNDQLHYDSGGEKGFGGNSRMTSEQIAEMLDDWRMSYADIAKGIQSIMDGNADNAAAKRLEIMLDRMLRNGYKDFHTGKMVEPNQEYIDTLNGIQANEEARGAFDDLVAHGDEYAPYVPGEVVAKNATTTEAPVAEKYEAIKPKATKEARMAKATPEEQAKTAKILFEAQTPKQKNAWKWAKEHIFRHGAVFEDMSLKTGNRELQAKFDNIRRAESRAQTFIGKGKGNAKALLDVRKAVDKAGKTEDFNYYLYHLHNVDRMTLEQRFKDVPNKSVFGDAVTAEVSRKAAINLETLNPEFKAWADDVYAINKHLLQMMVDEGIISQETAELWQKRYPHYVPISRAGQNGLNINVPLDTKRTGVNAPIKKATGGNSDFYNVFDTMGARIEQTFKAISKNRFGVELKNTLGTVLESEKADIDSVLESMDAHEELLQEGKNGDSPTFTVFENGQRVTFAIDEDMYEAMKPSQFTYTNQVLKKVNDVRRDVLTTYSPLFAVTNPIKDVQDILLNSQHPARTYATIPEAIKSVITKDQWYQERMENGGEQDSYFDGQTKTFKKEDGLFKKAMGFVPSKIQAVNEVIEQIPRMAEYIASRKMGRSVDVSMLDAARVTTNFGAPGDLTNMLNRNGFTFLGASVEGFNQQVRNVREAKAEGLKGWAKLAGKVVAAGLPAMLLNHLLWDDDEEYEELSDYVKQNYYVIAKTEDGRFIRIPKGRAVSVIQEAFQQMENLVTGNDNVDLGAFAQLVVNNLAPNNPLENNIIAPIYQAMTNKTWYGDDLVPTRLQDVPAAEQFDETTDSISRWLGEKTSTSPYKWNYLLDQYSGGVGDILLPYLTPEADGGGLGAAFRDKFSTDPVLKNQNVSDFYDKMDELAKNANSMYATDEDVLMNKYMSAVNSKLSELYQKKRMAQNSGVSDAEKSAYIREIQQQIVDIAREGLASYDDVSIDGVYATVGDQQFRWYEPGEDSTAEPGWKKLTADQIEKQDEVTKGLGIQPSEYWSNKEEYDFAYEYPGKYAIANAVGGYDTYKYYSKVLSSMEADKDENGKSISGSKKEKVIAYINDMDLSYGEKIILYRSMYDSKADREAYNMDIVDYLNSRNDISYAEMKTILEELGFKVDSKGNITWD